jgi:hypothetical protein
LSRHAARLRQSMLISCSISGKSPFVKLFTSGYKGKGPGRAPLVIFIKPVMLTLCKQGVITPDIPGTLSDTSHCWCLPSPMSDYVR